MTGVLNGIRVLDFGHYIAGSLAAMLLADHGAKSFISIAPDKAARWVRGMHTSTTASGE